MSLRPWFKQYPSDFIAGVTGMTGEQIGVYTVLLNLMYARKKRLPHTAPKDVQGLARASGVTTRRFNQVVDQLQGMPNKIQEIGGELTNPRFERWLAGEGARAADISQNDTEGTNSGELGPLFEPENSTKTRDNLDEKQPQNATTFIENKDLTSDLQLPVRARARSICQIPERTSVTGGSAAPGSGAAEHMTPKGFEDWAAACAKTIPRGWSKPAALKQWLKLPPIDTTVMVEAWQAYVDHNRDQSKGQRWKQKTRHPESWLKDRIYESFLQAAEQRQEAERNAAAALAARDKARTETLAMWGDWGTAVLRKIGAEKFDRHLIATTIKKTDAGGYEIDFHHNDRARSDADQLLWAKLEEALGGKVFFTSDRKRTSDAAFVKRQAKPPP